MAVRELAPWRGAHAEVVRSLGESGWARGSAGEVWIAGWGDIDMGEVGRTWGRLDGPGELRADVGNLGRPPSDSVRFLSPHAPEDCSEMPKGLHEWPRRAPRRPKSAPRSPEEAPSRRFLLTPTPSLSSSSSSSPSSSPILFLFLLLPRSSSASSSSSSSSSFPPPDPPSLPPPFQR